MIATFTARFTKIDNGYLGELDEWPEVITEGSDLDDCRKMLKDALREMVLAYREMGKEIPTNRPVSIQNFNCHTTAEFRLRNKSASPPRHSI